MLHIVNKSPTERPALATALRVAAGGALLLIEDGVYAALRDSAVEGQLREALGRFAIYALVPDLEARGVADRLLEGIRGIDYGGFVDLVAEHRTCQSWL